MVFRKKRLLRLSRPGNELGGGVTVRSGAAYFHPAYEREGRRFPHKEVTVVYVEEGSDTIILTCIARYGAWEVAS